MRPSSDLLAVCPVGVAPGSAGAWLWIAAWESSRHGSEVLRCALAAVELAVDGQRDALGAWIDAFDLARAYLRNEGRLISDDLRETFDQIVHAEPSAPAKPRAPQARAAADAIERLWYALEFGTIRSVDRALNATPGRDHAFVVRWSIEAIEHATAAGVDPSASIARMEAELAAIDRPDRVEEPRPAWRRGDPIVALARETTFDLESAARHGTDVDTWFASLEDVDDLVRVLDRTGVDNRTLIALALDRIEPEIGASANARAIADVVRGVLAGDEPIEAGMVWYRRAIADQPGGLRPGRPGGVPLELDDDERDLVQALADLALAFEHRTVAQALRRFHQWVAAGETGMYYGDEYDAAMVRVARDTCRYVIERTRPGDALIPEHASGDPIEQWDSRSRAWGLLHRLGAPTEQVLAARDANWSVTDWWAHTNEPAAMLSWLHAQPLALEQGGALVAGIVDRLADCLPEEAMIARLALARGRAGRRDALAHATAHGALVEAHTLAHKIGAGEIEAGGRDRQFAASIARRVIDACALTVLWHCGHRVARTLASCLTEASALLDPEAADEHPLDDEDLVARHRATVADWIRSVAPSAFIGMTG